MRNIAGTLVLAVVLAAAGLASAAPRQAASAAKKNTAAASHTVKGTVKSIDDSTLVLSRRKGGDMTFAVDSSTVREGAPAVGSDVSVRYRTEGKTMMATAITAKPAKKVAAAKPVASKPAAAKRKG